MKVSITGGSGFVGSRLLDYHLSMGDHVFVLTRKLNLMEKKKHPNLFIHYGDLQSPNDIPRSFYENADVLYHCAGELADKKKMVTVNIEGTLRLAELSKGYIRRWVQLSSIGVYGQHENSLVTENSKIKPSSLYEFSKAESDEIVTRIAKNSGFDYVILRPSNIFGPGMPNHSLVQLAKVIKKGWFHLIGPEGASANYIYIDNVVLALTLCATHINARSNIFNLSDFCTMEEFISFISAYFKRRISTNRVPLELMIILASIAQMIPGSPLTRSRVDALTSRTTYPINKINDYLNYRHVYSIQEGLNRTLQHFFVPDM